MNGILTEKSNAKWIIDVLKFKYYSEIEVHILIKLLEPDEYLLFYSDREFQCTNAQFGRRLIEYCMRQRISGIKHSERGERKESPLEKRLADRKEFRREKIYLAGW